MYTKLLVPLDGSSFGETALPLAADVARRAGARISLATVREPVATMVYQEWMSPEGGWEEGYLNEVAARAGSEAGVEMAGTVLSGPVAEALHRHALDTGADLIVMATHGRGPLTRAWLGSVADGLVRRSELPVLLVRPDPEEESLDLATARLAPLTNVLIPLDGSEHGEHALAVARELGDLYDARYTLLRVVHYPAGLASPYLPETVTMNQELVEEARERATAYLDEVRGRLRDEGVEADTEVLVEPQPAEGIIHFARDHEVDLVAMATHGRGGLSRALLGSVADKVLRGSHTPLLAIRPPEEEE